MEHWISHRNDRERVDIEHQCLVEGEANLDENVTSPHNTAYYSPVHQAQAAAPVPVPVPVSLDALVGALMLS